MKRYQAPLGAIILGDIRFAVKTALGVLPEFLAGAALIGAVMVLVPALMAIF